MSNDALLEAVLKTGVTLPTPSIAFARLQALSASDLAGPREMAQVVGKDPALTGALMRVANSPVFGMHCPSRSLQDAITLLGRTRTLAVCTSTALRSQSEGIDKRALDRVWQDSQLAADGAWRCARASRLRHLADEAYLAALLHDVGIPVLLRRFPHLAFLFWDSQVSLDQAAEKLDQTCNADHSAVSALVARNWKLATDVAEAIRCHHDAAAAGRLPEKASQLATLVAFGRLTRDGPSDAWLPWASLADQHLGLDPAGRGN